MQSPKVVAISASGVAVSYILTSYTMSYQLGTSIALPQLGVFLAACAGGPIWGLAAGLVGGLRLYYEGLGTTWLYVLLVVGAGAGLLSYRMRAAGAAILSWVTVGIVASYVIFDRSSSPAQTLYAWLTSFSYEVVISAVVVEAVLTLLHVSKTKAKKEAERSEAAAGSEAQVELGL